jgi:antitoxin MazE
MKSRIIPIGNSQGIRIPKALLNQTGLSGEVDLTVEQSALVVRPVSATRSGWDAAFSQMAALGDDKLLDADSRGLSSWDASEWQW